MPGGAQASGTNSAQLGRAAETTAIVLKYAK